MKRIAIALVITFVLTALGLVGPESKESSYTGIPTVYAAVHCDTVRKVCRDMADLYTLTCIATGDGSNYQKMTCINQGNEDYKSCVTDSSDGTCPPYIE